MNPQAVPINQQPAQPAAQDPLAALPPLALPEPVSWWPPAPGWWLLGVAGLLIASWLAARLWQHYRHGQAKRHCLRMLAKIYGDYDTHQSAQRYLAELNQLIKRFCLHYYPGHELAPLHGEPLLIELDHINGTPLLNSTIGQQLLGTYQPNPQVDAQQLHQLLRQWFNSAPLKFAKTRHEPLTTGAIAA